jgi:hypothetical protein
MHGTGARRASCLVSALGGIPCPHRNAEEQPTVDVRIGVTQTPKEIEIDLGDAADADAVVAKIEEALASDGGVLWLTDRRGRKVGIPSAKVAYVEVDGGQQSRQVGFGAGVK